MSNLSIDAHQAARLDALYGLREQRARRDLHAAHSEHQQADTLYQSHQTQLRVLRNEINHLAGLPTDTDTAQFVTHQHDRLLRARWLHQDMQLTQQATKEAGEVLKVAEAQMLKQRTRWLCIRQRRERLGQEWQDLSFSKRARKMSRAESVLSEQFSLTTHNSEER